MKNWLVSLAILALLAGPAAAQHQLTQYVTLFSGTGTGDGTTRLDVQSFASVLFKVRVDSTGTVNFKASADGTDTTDLGTCQLVSDTTAAQVDSTTASGDYWCSTANLKEVFVNVSANGSGVTVQAIGSTASAKRGGGGGGGSGTVTSVSASGGVETASGSAITGSGTIRGNTCVRTVTGTTDTITADDRHCLILYSNADSIAVSIAEAGTTGFDHGFAASVRNIGAGTVTITPATSEIDGAPDLILATGASTRLVSDGTHYVLERLPIVLSPTPSLAQVADVGRQIANANSLPNAVREGSSATGRYWVRYDDVTEGLIWDCLVSDVLSDCDKIVKLLDGKEWGVKDQAGTRRYTIDHTGTVKKGIVDCTLADVECRTYGKLPGCGGQLVAVSATGTADHIWTKATGATVPTATAQVGANRTRGIAVFPDSDGDYGYEFECLLHAGWEGPLDAKVVVDSTGSGNFVAQISTKCYASNDADDAAFNTASAHTFTLGTASRPNIYTATNITATGCAGGSILRAKLIRNRTHGSDTATAALNVERFEFWGRTIY